MPVLNYNPVPSQTPDISSPGGFQNIQASPRAFGSDVGEGLSALGAQFERAGEKMADIAVARQNIFNQVAVDEATVKWRESVEKLMYGDPETGDTGFNGLKGRQALDAYPNARKRFDDLVKEHRGALQNPIQQHLFDRTNSQARLFTLNEMGRKYDRANNEWTESVYTGQLKLGEQGMAKAAANNDWSKFDTEVNNQIAAATKRGVFAGKSAEETQALVNNITANAVEVKAEALMGTDPATALQFIEKNREHFKDPQKFLEMKGRVQAKAEAQIVDDVVRGRPSKSGTSGLVRGGALDYATTKQYALDAGFRGEAADIMTAITFPESGGDPYAHNPKYPDDSYGITQINALAHGPKAKEAFGNPKRAMELAFEISKGGTDFRPWTTYTSGAYKSYLKPDVQPSPVKPVEGPDQLITVPLEPGELPDSSIPGLPDVIKERLKDPRVANSPELQRMVIKQLRQEANAAYSAQQHSRTLQLQTEQEQDKSLLNSYIARTASNSTNYPTIDEIKLGPGSAAMKENAIGFVLRESRPETDAKQSAANQRLIFARMQPDYEGEDKITSESQLNRARIDGSLTRADWAESVKDLQDIQDPTGPRFTKKIGETLKGIEAKFVPAIVGLGRERAYATDSTAGSRVAAWKEAVKGKIAEYQSAGKNPNDLFVPGKPDYVGSQEFIAPYVGSIAQRMQDPKPLTVTLEQINKMTTLQELQKATQDNPRLREAAKARALELGLVRAPAAPPMAR